MLRTLPIWPVSMPVIHSVNSATIAKEVIRSILVVEGEQKKFWPLAELANMLKAGARLVFPTVAFSERMLDSHVLSLPRERNVFLCMVIRTGAFNDAELANGAPKLPISLIGVIHRTLLEGGSAPQWCLHEGTYQSLIGRGDYLEVSV